MKNLLKTFTFIFAFTSTNCIFCMHKNLKMAFNGYLEKEEADIKWNESNLKDRVNEIYDYALDEMDKICGFSEYIEEFQKLFHHNAFVCCRFGTLTHLMCTKKTYSKCGSDIETVTFKLNTVLENAICSGDEARFTEQFRDFPFMRFLIKNDCFYWKEGNDGNRYLLPCGIPSKKILRALHKKFRRRLRLPEKGVFLRELSSNYGPYDGEDW